MEVFRRFLGKTYLVRYIEEDGKSSYDSIDDIVRSRINSLLDNEISKVDRDGDNYVLIVQYGRAEKSSDNTENQIYHNTVAYYLNKSYFGSNQFNIDLAYGRLINGMYYIDYQDNELIDVKGFENTDKYKADWTLGESNIPRDVNNINTMTNTILTNSVNSVDNFSTNSSNSEYSSNSVGNTNSIDDNSNRISNSNGNSERPSQGYQNGGHNISIEYYSGNTDSIYDID